MNRSIEELLWHMPTVHRMARDEWAKGFAESVLKQARRRGWRPSVKQLAMMQRMFTGPDDGALIE
jgi:hypothetical protein